MAENQTDFTDAQCRRFIEATADRETSELFIRAMDLAGSRGRSLELGCGAGNDGLAMLLRGFAVDVVDEKPAAIDAVKKLAEAEGLAHRLTAHLSDFESFVIEPATFDLINARFSLPFCRPEDSPSLWRRIVGGLGSGGVFTGQFFGPHDSFVNDPERTRITGQTRDEVVQSLEGLIVHQLEEVEKDGYTATGRAKHWHVYHILAQQPT